MKKFIQLASIVPCLVLAGCLQTIPIAPGRDLITITPEMVQECDLPPDLVGQTVADVVKHDAAALDAFLACDAKNHDKVELMRKIFGVKVDNSPAKAEVK